MNRHTATRRRFVGISAAAGGLALLPPGAAAQRTAEGAAVTWRGVVLGAVGTIVVHHPDRIAAERLVARALNEVRRLDGLFSLYREDSALVALNRRGALEAPPADMVRLLAACARYAELTGGAFDPTVQPLWRLYFEHFSRPGADPAGPPAAALSAALGRVGYGRILVGRDRIALGARGMQVTLNGIAQGYITDRIVELLRDGGIERTMVDLGEARVLGSRPDGRPWQVGLADPDDPGRVRETLGLVDRAVATSGGYGMAFDPAGRFGHILDPRTGASPRLHRSVSVVAPDATTADALSTAFSLMPPPAIDAALARLRGVAAHLVHADGSAGVRTAG
ncbi:FAD:protein FMN transferase [Craurococcus roseus]|uniref:FAD:protein FMN transferase n=1 Tax=Craurococcus roseus TaxID=77585 RepID=UPI0031D8A1E9